MQKYADADEALALYATAISAYPDNPDLLYNRALFVVELGDFAWMERDLLKLLEEDPDHADALNALGYTLADRNERLDEAFAYVARALKLRPDSPAILDSMGWAYYRLGEHEKALRYLQHAFDKLKDPEIAAHLGEVLWVLGDKERARKIWDEALRATPQDKVLLNVIERFAR